MNLVKNYNWEVINSQNMMPPVVLWFLLLCCSIISLDVIGGCLFYFLSCISGLTTADWSPQLDESKTAEHPFFSRMSTSFEHLFMVGFWNLKMWSLGIVPKTKVFFILSVYLFIALQGSCYLYIQFCTSSIFGNKNTIYYNLEHCFHPKTHFDLYSSCKSNEGDSTQRKTGWN